MDRETRNHKGGFASVAQAVHPSSPFPSLIGQWNMSLLTSVVRRGDLWTTRLLVSELKIDPNLIVLNEPETIQRSLMLGMPSYQEKESQWPNVGNTAILIAIAEGNTSMVKLLCELGADINLKSPRQVKFTYEFGSLKRTDVLCTHFPLLLAIEREDIEMIHHILDLGGDPTPTGWMKTRNNQLVCGNALCLAKLQFEGRHPHTIRKLHSSFEKVVQERNLLSAKEYKEKLEKVTLELSRAKEMLAHMNGVFQNLKKNLECIICIDIPENACKIFSCLNGHAICEMCLKRVIECPLCKISYRQSSTVRLRIAENIISEMVKMF